VLPFRTPAPSVIARRRSVGIWIAIGVVALSLYTAAIWLILTPIPGVRHAPGERVTASSAQASEPDPEPSASASDAPAAEPSARASAAPSTTASASPRAPLPTFPARPIRVTRPPVRRSPWSDVHDPWGYE
jgi:hypothetical protein